jgi:hypothetical protein
MIFMCEYMCIISFYSENLNISRTYNYLDTNRLASKNYLFVILY